MVFPHTTPDGRLVNLYGRAVGTAEQVPTAKRHDHLPGDKGYFNAVALREGADPLWVCEGAFDALALLAAGVPRVVAIFGVQGWRWAWARAVRALVLALDAAAAGPQQWRTLARQAALRGKRVAGLPAGGRWGAPGGTLPWAGAKRAFVFPIRPRACALLDHRAPPYQGRGPPHLYPGPLMNRATARASASAFAFWRTLAGTHALG